MKKSFLKIAAFAAMAGCLMVSCGKENTDNGTTIKPDGGNEQENLHESLKGSEYVVVALDDNSLTTLGNKVKLNLGVDDVTRHFYVWDNTYVGGTCAGLNFYGEASEWTSLVVTSVGWSGAAWFSDVTIPAFASSAEDLANWKFHCALKGVAGKAHNIVLTWNGATYKFAIGDGSIEIDGVKYDAIAPVGGKFTAGIWNEYEVNLVDTGLNYSVEGKSDNYISILSGGETGKVVDIDALFFYKK